MRSNKTKKVFAWILSAMLITSLLPGLVFAEDGNGEAAAAIPFTASAGDSELTKVNPKDGGYTPYAFDAATYEMKPASPVMLYVIDVPEDTSEVELTFPEDVLAYNYTADGATYLAGEYENDGKTGVKDVTVQIDFDKNGEMDCIQVQTPYDDNWSSTTLYAITFEKTGTESKNCYDDTVGHWAEDAINKVTDRGWMNGVAERKFAPDTTLSRAMFVTMLYRIEMPWAGAPDKKEPWPEKSFTDVEKGSWYEEAVAWAAANDIVKGTSETTFSPNANVTREQMAAFLSRYTESKDSPSQSAAQTALPNEESQGGLDRYLDKDQISDWALESMSWAVGQGLINGVTENQLQPKGTATRAQAATILIRFDERILQSN